jgi:predicted HicB family RNase H-like nuclease
MAQGRPRLAAAIARQQQPQTEPPAAEPETPTQERGGGKAVGFSLRLDTAAHEQLRRMAFDSRRSIHALVIEAINDLFTKHGKPPIA